LRCPRTHSGRRPGRQDGRCAPSAFHGRPRTGALADVFRLEVTAEPGVHPGVAARRSARLPGMDKGRPDGTGDRRHALPATAIPGRPPGFQDHRDIRGRRHARRVSGQLPAARRPPGRLSPNVIDTPTRRCQVCADRPEALSPSSLPITGGVQLYRQSSFSVNGLSVHRTGWSWRLGAAAGPLRQDVAVASGDPGCLLAGGSTSGMHGVRGPGRGRLMHGDSTR
jgi:hypothetical protein